MRLDALQWFAAWNAARRELVQTDFASRGRDAAGRRKEIALGVERHGRHLAALAAEFTHHLARRRVDEDNFVVTAGREEFAVSAVGQRRDGRRDAGTRLDVRPGDDDGAA